jgi:hypothetical protein
MDDDKYYEILLKEYAEAGLLGRNSEQLTRTALSLFIPVATALVALVVTPALEPPTKLALSLAGLAYALLLVDTVHRHTAYYMKYVGRAKEIETLIKRDDKPIMQLYSAGATATSGSRTISNKHAVAATFWIAVAYFAIAALYYAGAVYGPHAR